MADSDNTTRLVERYQYRVVYPAGVSVRLNPSIDSAKSGEVISCGSVVEASKSLVLDGVNYVKLSNGRGWVFGKKGDADVLELVNVLRVPDKPRKATKRSISESDFFIDDSHSEPASTVPGTKPATKVSAPVERISRSRPALRSEQLFWRDLKSKVYECKECEGLFQIASIAYARDVTRVDPKVDEQQRHFIKLLVAITQRTIQTQYFPSDLLAACIWFILNIGHKGSRIAISLVDEAANKRFENLTSAKQHGLLDMLTGVAERSKATCVELGKLAEILPDDIRSFQQRLIMVKLSEDALRVFDVEDDHLDSVDHDISTNPFDDDDANESDKVPSATTSTIPRGLRSTTTNPFDDDEDDGDGTRGRSSNLSQQHRQTPSSSSASSPSRYNAWTSVVGQTNVPQSRTQWLSSLFCSSIRSIGYGAAGNDEKGDGQPGSFPNAEAASGTNTAEAEDSDLEAASLTYTEILKNKIRIGIERQVAKFSDPDMQFASLI